MDTLGTGHSDTGRMRDANEDTFLADSELGLFVVSDGMGGHAAGEVASSAAVEVVARIVSDEQALIERVGRGKEDVAALTALAERAVLQACDQVHQLSRTSPEYGGMGCTLTMLITAGQKAAMAHVGDSRLYLLRQDEAHQLSVDHTLADELVRAGVLTPENARTSGHAHVLTRALGTQPAVAVDTLVIDLLPRDRFLLCSDGLSEYIPDNDWLADQIADEDFENIPDKLIAFANEAGGRDNIAAVVVKVDAATGERPVVVALTSEFNIKLEALDSVFLFEDLTMAQLTRILAICEVRELAAGEVLVKDGDPWGALTMVMEGALLVGAGDHIRELASGEYLGQTNLLRPGRAREKVRASERTRVLLLESGPFQELTMTRPWLGVALLTRLGRRLSRDLERSIGDGAAS